MKNKLIILSFILIIFLFGIFVNLINKNTNFDNRYIKVTLKGGVSKTGTYFCKYGTSISEVLLMAGGIKDTGYLPENLDYNTPITEDIIINIPNKYSTIKKSFEEN